MIGKVVTIARIAVALVLIHAAARAGIAASKYYRFREAAYQIVLRGGSAPTDQVGDAFYVEYLPLVPGYTYPAELSLSVQSQSLAPAAFKNFKQ